ncbi:MAG: DnaB-like helicase C-terminal domain-containing protein [Nannocystaceae bacterium]
MADKPLVFISHITEEKELAQAFKAMVEHAFLGLIEVFVSSDAESISMGEHWLETVRKALKRCKVEIVVCSPISVTRPWIQFEAGAGWIRDISVIPLCHSGMTPSRLPIPLNMLQGATTTDVKDIERVLHKLAKVLGSETPAVDIAGFVAKAATFEEQHLSMQKASPALSSTPVAKQIHKMFESLTERAKLKNPITGVPTGFHKLDEITGGMQPGDLIILAARPSMGKTALALNLVQHACITQAKHQHLPEDDQPRRYPTLVFSLEMSKEQLIERLVCSEARVDASRVRTARLVEADFRELAQAADRLHKGPLFINEEARAIQDIEETARRWRNFDGVAGLVVVDSLHLVEGDSPVNIARRLKRLARELECPVLLISPVNPAVDERSDPRPVGADITAGYEEADLILFIYREVRYFSDYEEQAKVDRDAEVIIGKHRNGPTGTVHLVFRGEHTRFENPTYDW